MGKPAVGRAAKDKADGDIVAVDRLLAISRLVVEAGIGPGDTDQEDTFQADREEDIDQVGTDQVASSKVIDRGSQVAF